jgi:hypothetical protein
VKRPLGEIMSLSAKKDHICCISIIDCGATRELKA